MDIKQKISDLEEKRKLYLDKHVKFKKEYELKTTSNIKVIAKFDKKLLFLQESMDKTIEKKRKAVEMSENLDTKFKNREHECTNVVNRCNKKILRLKTPINIEQLMEDPGPSTALTTSVQGVTSTIQNQILTEIKRTFTIQEQELYINSLMLYMNYHQTNDYVVNLEHVYKMIGFTKIGNTKVVLVKNFIENEDYKIQEDEEVNIASAFAEAVFEKQNGGQNKQTILLNIDTFKNLCMVARTEKAKEMRRYFVKIESLIHSVISKTIQPQLSFTQDQINNSNKLIEHFGSKTNVFYLFSFTRENETYAKFGIAGNTREFHNRIKEHRLEFGDICFYTMLQCSDVAIVENEFKATSLFNMNKTKVPKKYGNGKHTEILRLNGVVTLETIKSEMFKTTANRCLDPPPLYDSSLEIERERTKQIQLQI